MIFSESGPWIIANRERRKSSNPTMTPVADSHSPQPSASTLYTAIGLLWLCIFGIALTGYPDLMDNERRVGAYVLDAVQNGYWICQRDVTGDIASKPPLLTWIASMVVLATGQLSRLAVYLPSALGTLGVAFVILGAGRKYFGWVAGFLGALAYLLSPAADNQVVTARYDGFFALPVALGALAAFRSWQSGRGWIWFWLASAMATMIKGPLGLILAGGGLWAVLWEWRSGNSHRLRGSYLAGLVPYLLIPGVWFAFAYLSLGQPLIDKMLGRELVGHVIEDGPNSGGLLSYFWQPTWEVTTQFLPWSILAGMGFWRIIKRPSQQDETRRFERFLFCWFFFGLFLFSVAAHQRGRLIFPLLPVAAMLAGRELSVLLKEWQPVRLFRAAFALSLFVLGFLLLYHHFLLQWARHIEDTASMKHLAQSVREKVGAQFPLTHVDSPFAIQFSLNTMHRWVPVEQAAELLRGEDAAFVVVYHLDKLEAALGTNGPPVYELLSAPLLRKVPVRVISNHPRLEWTDRMAVCFGPLSLRMDHVRVDYASEKELVFEPLSSAGTDTPSGTVTISNISDGKLKLSVRTAGGHPGPTEEVNLAPGEARQMTIR
jgi:Dolichyl-phosphate-mannose-protein mannosyltransferase